MAMTMAMAPTHVQQRLKNERGDDVDGAAHHPAAVSEPEEAVTDDNDAVAILEFM